MRYRLIPLAPGSYDLVLGSKIIGSVVRQLRSNNREPPRWLAELLDESAPFPAPFVSAEHEFAALEDIIAWLGEAEIASRPQRHGGVTRARRRRPVL